MPSIHPKKTRTIGISFFFLFLFAIPPQHAFSQTAGTTAVRPQRPPAYPQRETDPEAVARGQEIYDTHGCGFCHGSDTRGGNGGPSLLRSQLVQRDRQGETIAPTIRNGVPNTEMTAFDLNDREIADVAEFLHSFNLQSRDPSRFPPESIVVGDAAAGRAYFDATCAGCHSIRGDLMGLASRYSDPLDLQTNWLMPEQAPPATVTVTQPDGTEVSGELTTIDEFLVSLDLPNGRRRTFRRRGDVPGVEIHDPLQTHRDLLRSYSDADIHNITAYLAGLEE